MDTKKNAVQALSDAFAHTGTSSSDWHYIAINLLSGETTVHMNGLFNTYRARKLTELGFALTVCPDSGEAKGNKEIGEEYLGTVYVRLG
jgi:hypothetical protein